MVGIVDRDKEEIAKQLQQNFPDYLFLAIPADDVRTKEARPETPEKVGLLDGGALRDEFKLEARAIIEKVNHYLLN